MTVFPLVLLFGICLSSASAGPALKATARKPLTQTFFPPTSFQTFDAGVDHPLSRRDGSLADAASAFVETQLKVDSKTVKFKSGYSSDIAQYAYIKQQHNNITFANSVANVAFKDGKVVSFGNSFSKPSSFASSTPTVSVDAAISAAEKALDGTHNKIPTTLEYLVNADNTATLIHVVQVQNQAKGTWYEAFVDAHSGKFISAIDLVANAAYRVLPIFKQDLTEGFEFLVNPQNLASSPLGWHNDGNTATNDTSGNNALAYLDQDQTATTPQSAPGLIFNYTQDPTVSPSEQVATACSPLVQNSQGIDNANFGTPPDGQSGQMNMYLWDITDPERDGGLENDIVTHEMTHGITNRMTGGGTGRCLQIVESQGLGEGWSDTMADWMEQVGPTIVDFTLGSYVDGGVPIRSRPYSTNSTTNPYTYSTLLEVGEVHDIGEIWANMLHNVLAALVDARGFSKTARTDPSGSEGNVIFLHLFIDALALQPCQPDFLQARDAIIQADQNRYAGANKCVLWKAFASRGLGFKAFDYTDDFSLPDGC
ncbi:Extracellular metalloproteinase [Mycena venus]|uniref:Extracellular metalloproteinase n=1 Tax=Mycena venus TaxID=2733690 RepID=A0A8H6XIG2_9AGAR|nr:Extracellular metalloproteinase [Mycena venus]